MVFQLSNKTIFYLQDRIIDEETRIKEADRLILIYTQHVAALVDRKKQAIEKKAEYIKELRTIQRGPGPLL